MLIRRAGAPRRAPNQEETWCEIKFVGHVKRLLSEQRQRLPPPPPDQRLLDYAAVVGLINRTIVRLRLRFPASLLHCFVFF